jgi:hypothetical protein
VKDNIIKALLLLFFLCLQNAHALDAEITRKEIEANLKGEYNRSLSFCGDLSAIGTVELNSHYTFRGGAAFGIVGESADIKICADARYNPFTEIPAAIELAYVYNGLPGYQNHNHTILPTLSYNSRWAGIALGVGFRFTSFLNEPAIFESMLSFSVYANFIDNEILRMGISCANYDDFGVGNMGSYSLKLNCLVRFNSQWSLVNELGFLQSGSVALSSNFYGIAYRGGMRFSW